MSLVTRIRNRLGRFRTRNWRNATHVSAERPIVIGGSPRSGTTLLRRMLDSHSDIVCGPETSLFLPGEPQVELLAFRYEMPVAQIREMVAKSSSQSAFIETFFRSVAKRAGKGRWSEKTPLNVWYLDWIWLHFPGARFIHVIRDGRDVVCSMRTHGERRLVDGKIVEVPPKPEPLERTVGRWLTHTGKGMRHRRDPRYLEIRYEDLVDRPREILERVLSWVGEPFEPGMLEARDDGATAVKRGEEWDASAGIERSSVGRWRRDLSPQEIALVERLAGTRLKELGYEV